MDNPHNKMIYGVNVRNITFIIFLTVFIILLLGAGVFYWKNLRGAGAAFRKPKQRITEVINTTGMPLKLPEGFSISIFAKDLGAPRVMAFDRGGNLLVSIPSQGRVVALPDKNSDGVADETVTVVDKLNKPHGIAFLCDKKCRLYVAETNQVSFYNYDEKNLKAKNKKKIISLPGGGNHFTRTILFQNIANNNYLYTSIGSSCNVCKEKDWRRASILLSDENGKGLGVYAKGLRNSVFMAENPFTGHIWATEMGRDLLGDDLPPDEINIISGSANYGWPYCYGIKIRDETFAAKSLKKNFCWDNTDGSYIDIPAHSAPLGLAFIPEQGWPKEYWHDLLVSYHGSWNRSVPTGYKIVRFKLNEKGYYAGREPETEDFISGWIREDGSVVGRPVDIIALPNGAVYISDDKGGVIYKVELKGA